MQFPSPQGEEGWDLDTPMASEKTSFYNPHIINHLKRDIMNFKIYQGYGGGMPVFTIDGNRIYQGYGGGMPVYTVDGNKVYSGYGGGMPVFTVGV
jgi:hypothetical protein